MQSCILIPSEKKRGFVFMKLMAIDGNSILNRAFYGIRLLTNREGLYTNAVYGFLSTMFRLQDAYQPDRTVVCFDLRAKTFRHKEYEAYKGTRKGMPDELAVQLPVIKEVLGAMGIPCLEQEGFEADDLLGTVSRQANAHGDTCYVVTGDKDSLQLIGNGTIVLLVSTKGGQTLTTEYTEELFLEEYGFPPIRMIDLKGLMGDSSDNIPGVPGIGQKTATALLQKFGSVEGVYEHIDDPFIKKGQRAKLLDGRESAEMSLHLATIVRDVPMECDVTQLPEAFMDADALYHLFTRLEFKNFITRLGLTPPEQEEAEREQALETDDLSDGAALLEAITGAERVFLTVTHSLSALCAVVGEHAYTLTADAVGTEQWHELLNKLFSEYPLVMHDGKPVLTALLAEGIVPRELAFDTGIGAYLLDPTQAGYDLERVALAYLNRELPAPSFEQEDAFSPLGGAEDAKHNLAVWTAAVRDLYEQLAPKIEEQGMHELCYDIELPLMNVLAEMQQVGVQTDAAALRAFGDTLGGRIDQLTREIYAQAGEEFNINSPKQLGVILFEKLGLPVIKKTKSGYSTNADVLEQLRPNHCIVDMILEYRMLTKLNSTYVEGLLKVIQPDGRIRSTFNQTGTATGRLSSSEPNLQNIPVRQELGSQLRKIFVAKPGCVLVDADYSQIELRVLAHISRDQTMIDGFNGGSDIHAITASQVFGVPIGEVTAHMRRSAKAVNFGIVYGISSFSLAGDIGVSVAQAKKYMESYLATYHGVREYMERIKEEAKEQGYVCSLLGRRRYLPELKSKNFNIRSFGERVALNTPIQSTAADIIKIAMVRVARRLKAEQMQTKLILQVHDELILEAPEAEAEHAKALLQEEMERAFALDAPLRADAAVGVNWYSAKG